MHNSIFCLGGLVREIKPRALHTLGKYPTSELHAQPPDTEEHTCIVHSGNNVMLLQNSTRSDKEPTGNSR